MRSNLIKVSFILFLGITIAALPSYELAVPTSASPPPTDIKYMDVPSFVNQKANYINYPEQLASFFHRLQALENGQIKQVRIVHIGDSHLQAGYLPGEIRKLLQSVYGNAGRGLVFPYQLAKTNSPGDFLTQSNVSWECAKNVSLTQDFPVGLCGYSLRSFSPEFKLSLQLKDNPLNEAFDKVTIFGPNTEAAFDLIVQQESNGLVPYKVPSQKIEAGTCFQFETAQRSISICAERSNESQRFFTLHGILLENSQNKGILYSSIGVNGATFSSYYRSPDFMKQLAALEPDLIIISLGTNEAHNANMKIPFVQENMEGFLNQLKEQVNCRAVMLCTPPDIYIKSRYKTRNSQLIAELMHDVAKLHGLALWDFFEVMGGYGAVSFWHSNNLVQGDRVHFTSEGYRLTGQLLFKAMQDAYLKQKN